MNSLLGRAYHQADKSFVICARWWDEKQVQASSNVVGEQRTPEGFERQSR